MSGLGKECPSGTVMVKFCRIVHTMRNIMFRLKVSPAQRRFPRKGKSCYHVKFGRLIKARSSTNQLQTVRTSPTSGPIGRRRQGIALVCIVLHL